MQQLAKTAGAFNAVVCSHWAEGGYGAMRLAEAVEQAANQESSFKFLYDLDVSVLDRGLNFFLNLNI